MEKYTTSELLEKNPIAEKGKTILTNDAYAVTEGLMILNEVVEKLNNLIASRR